MFQSIHPATGEKIREFEETPPAEVKKILERSDAAFGRWRRLSFAERGKFFKKAAAILGKKKEDFARLMALEMGKPLAQGTAEAEKCALGCEYYAAEAERFLSPQKIKTDASSSYIAFEPLGVILAVMPWNFPFWQVFRAAAPALMAGNTMILKHAPNVLGCAEAIEGVFKEAGFPEGVFGNVFVDHEEFSKMMESPIAKAVTLTGSTRAGRAVASKAGQMLKKSVLELGGSDAYVVLEDADLELAAEACASSRLINAGQSCVAAKRFIVVEAVRKAFEEKLVRRMQSQKMGDPLDKTVTVGPLARMDLRDALHRQVEKSVSQGAKLLLGGKLPEGKGAFYPPTVLTGVKKGMAAFDEETFGPVAAVVPVQDEKEAIRLANDNVYGLGGAVFTRDLKRGERIAKEELEAGLCFVNAYVKSDPRLPFGGVKDSGYGRELSHLGIQEFVNAKTVYIR